MRRAQLALVTLFASDGFAAEGECDKSQYDAFHRTPAACLREMSTDRPDQTESAYTVDAGWVQIEMDLASYSVNDDDGLRSEVWNVAPINVKVGLQRNIDLQLVLDTYVDARFTDDAAGTVQDASGFGDATLRIKFNVWGNDGGKTAFAVMPFLKLPLPESELRNGEAEGGIIFPFGMDLGNGWGLGAMTEVDVFAGDSNENKTAWVNSIAVGRDLTENLGMYVELFAVVARSFPWRGQADVGWTYAFTDNARLDWGCNFGVTDSAPDYNPFVGFSARF